MKKGTFLKKILHPLPHPTPPPYSIPFPNVLHQNKALHNFQKRGAASIVEHDIGLEHELLTS